MAATRAKIESYVQRLVAAQPQRVQTTLARIPNHRRHLLAVRGYIRHADRIDDRWAMTDAEERAFRATPAFQTMRSEVRQIQRRFASTHRGYSLSAVVAARSLDTQIRMWNGNDTVLALGRRLHQLVRVELGRARYPAAPTDAAVEAFHDWIGDVGLRATVDRERDGRTVRLTVRSPSNATPGLSSHGKIRALDFVVKRGAATVAGADMARVDTVWRGNPNWANRLNAAISAVSNSWDGPLAAPDEPWHYTYDP